MVVMAVAVAVAAAAVVKKTSVRARQQLVVRAVQCLCSAGCAED
jgi:hypothetical protein